MRLVLLVCLLVMASVPESQQLEPSGIRLGILLQKPKSSAIGTLNTLSSQGSVAMQSSNRLPSNSPDPYSAIPEQDVLSNTFGMGGIQLAYSDGERMSKEKCKESCRTDESCVVAMYCHETPVQDICANPMSCTITKIEKGGLCHIYVQADNPSYLPDSNSASSCQFLSIHPNCRNPPQVSNTHVDQHPTPEDGVVRYRYTCLSDYENVNKGSVFGVCDKQGGWIVPSLSCKPSTSNGVPSSMNSLVQKVTAVEGKPDQQRPVEVPLLPSKGLELFGKSPAAATPQPPTDAPTSMSALEQAAEHIKSQIMNGT
ncbi:uncharacterized protein LOC124146723 [Haliotis rufescens]|uniref:uncharacterized protein LOC124146723 n=1 Tax=Haliotis rufescens TaxID=6454 RepID=UPI001EAF8E46|nr:uncharacterized protein LOC124146723 [Haliotis rufescens]